MVVVVVVVVEIGRVCGDHHHLVTSDQIRF